MIKLIKQNNKCKLNQFHQHSEVFNKLSTAHKSTINSEKVHLNGVLINHDNVKSLSFSNILIIKSSQYSLTLWFVELFSPRYSFLYNLYNYNWKLCSWYGYEMEDSCSFVKFILYEFKLNLKKSAIWWHHNEKKDMPFSQTFMFGIIKLLFYLSHNLHVLTKFV